MNIIQPSKTKLAPCPISISIDDIDGINERFDVLENELEKLYKKVPFGLHTLNKAGHFLTINQQELDWLGYTTKELVGFKRFEELLTLESQERYQNYLDKYLNFGFLGDVELSLIASNGEIRNVALYSQTILDDIGIVDRYRSVLFDINERKAMEAGLLIAAAAFETQEGVFITDAHTIILRVN